MSRAIFFNIPASGHVNPSLPLTAELVRRGEQIIYYGTENFRRKIEATGAEFRPYQHFDDSYFERNRLTGANPPMAAAHLIAGSRQMLPDLLAMTRDEQPDYLLYDSMCPWGALVGRVLGLPSVVSLSLLVYSPAAMMRSFGLRTILPMIIGGFPHILRFQRETSAIGREYRIKPLEFGEAFNAPGDLILSYTSAAIQPGADKIDARIQFVGPSIAARGDTGDFPLERLDGKPVIYISLGTLVNDHPEFFRACLQAFADSPYTVVMSIGDKVAPESLGAIPPNFVVRPFNPQLEILQRSALFITHAGMNSVHEGLYYDVPLLLVPQQAEQAFVALRIQELGAGLRQTDFTPDAIRLAAERILGDGQFKQRATALGESLREAGGYARAADLVLEMVGKRSKTS